MNIFDYKNPEWNSYVREIHSAKPGEEYRKVWEKYHGVKLITKE